MPEQPLRAEDARRLITRILGQGSLVVSRHFRNKLPKENLSMLDATHVLRTGTVEEAEWENGSWRHRVRTSRIVMVIAFSSESELLLVTTWRTQ